MTKRIVFALSFLAVTSAWAQPSPLVEVLQFYGDSCGGYFDQVRSFIQTTDGGYLLTGHTQRINPPPVAQTQIWLARLDSVGNLLWDNAYGYSEYGHDAVETADGGFLVAGAGEENFNVEFLLLKVDSQGEQQWMRYFSETAPAGSASSIAQTFDGGYVLVGSVNTDSTEAPDMCLLKTDAQGNLQWIRSYDSGGGEHAVALGLASDGGFVLAGTRYPSGSADADLFVVRTSSAGDTLWQRRYARQWNQNPGDISVLIDGSFVVCGYDAASANTFLAKISDSGSQQWWRSVSNSDSLQLAASLAVVPEGFLLAGTSGLSNNPTRHAYIARTDEDGNEVWHRTIAARDVARASGIVALQDGRIAVGGSTQCIVGNGIMAPDGFFILTGLDEGSFAQPPVTPYEGEFQLWAYPNPFNSSSNVTFLNPDFGWLALELFTLDGRHVRTLASGYAEPGQGAVTLAGADLATGSYFIRLHTRDQSQVIKVMLVK